MNHLGLFEGIGGFSLAVKWAGGKTLAWCEWNEFGQKVLRHHFPEAEGFGDITKTDFRKYEGQIDLLTGGFPCQPFSLAGKRKGTDDERYLWHEMLRAIQEVKPTYVIAENVYGIVNIDGGLVFEQVCADLEGEGYEVQAFIIPACSKNAPHRRDRVYFVAYSNSNGHKLWRSSENRPKKKKSKGERDKRKWFWNDSFRNGSEENATNSSHTRLQGSKNKRIIDQGWEKRHKQFARRIPSSWQNFPTQSPICGGDDGLPTELDRITFSKWRAESIKAYGNAIVPQVAFEIITQLFNPDQLRETPSLNSF